MKHVAAIWSNGWTCWDFYKDHFHYIWCIIKFNFFKMIKLSNFFGSHFNAKKNYTLKEWMYSIVYLCHIELLLLRVKELVELLWHLRWKDVNRSCLIFLIFSQDQLTFKEKLLIKGLVHWLIVIVILTLVDCNCHTYIGWL